MCDEKRYEVHPSSLPALNLREYMAYTINMSGWKVLQMGNLLLTLNGKRDSLFNYVFRLEDTQKKSEESAIEVLDYLSREKIDATWVVDSHEKSWEYFLVNDIGLSQPTVMKKTFLKIPKIACSSTDYENLDLEIVNTDASLAVLGELAEKIFYCNSSDLAILLKGLTKQGQSRLRFFIVKFLGAAVGVCAMYIHNEVVGLYSDGVLTEYRNMGIAREAILRRLHIAAKEQGCKYAVAQCNEQSVNLYRKLGFKVTGNLFLYSFLAVE